MDQEEIEDLVEGHESSYSEIPDRIDYVIVYSELEQTEIQNIYRENYFQNLCMNGLELKLYKDDGDDRLVFILVTVPMDVFFQMAEKLKLKLPIAYNDLYEEKHFSKLYKLDFFTPREIKLKNGRKFFTTPYVSSLHNKFIEFFEDQEEKDILLDKDYITITYEILSRTTFSRKLEVPQILNDDEGDQRIGIRLLLANETFKAAFPLHENYGKVSEDPYASKTNRQLLLDYWAKPSSVFFYQPLDIIRLYFGEKLAFYFAWLGFYTTWLILPSIAGILVIVYGFFTLAYDIPTNEICNMNSSTSSTIMCPLCNYHYCKTWNLHESCLYSKMTYLVDNPATVLFSLFMAVWTVLFIEFWKREQSKWQFEWDTMNTGKKIELCRPEFELNVKDNRKNPITGELEPFLPTSEKFKRYSFSVTITLLMVCLVLACILGVMVYRISLLVVLSNSENLRSYAMPIISISAAVINIIIIILLTKLYSWLAVKLTDLECHRTDSNYENSLTLKMYLFQFVNFYSSIFYIAFFKGRHRFIFDYIEPCEQSGCLTELTITLGVVMLGEIAFNAFEILNPILTNYFTNKKSKVTRNSKMEYIIPDSSQEKRWKLDYNLNSWIDTSFFDEYLEIVVQFGFITMFVVAFPLGPLIAFLGNVFEIRVDSFKAVTQFRRSTPKRDKDIGVWLPILSIISKIGIITNGAIIAFTSEFIPRFVYKYGAGQGTLEGYVNHTLSLRIVNEITAENEREFLTNLNVTECKYRDFSEKFEKTYQYSHLDYEVILARVVFLLVFEHIAFFLVALMQKVISDKPKYVSEQTEREAIITQKALWQTNPLNRKNIKNCIESSNRFLRVFRGVPIANLNDAGDNHQEDKMGEL